jgi:hypothetical protein
VLDRDIKVLQNFPVLRNETDQFVVNFIVIEIVQADPFDPVDSAELLQ